MGVGGTHMKRLALGVALMLTVNGCAAVKGYFTEPTGVITIERQDFLDTWALVTVLAEDFFRGAGRACAGGGVARRHLCQTAWGEGAGPGARRGGARQARRARGASWLGCGERAPDRKSRRLS